MIGANLKKYRTEKKLSKKHLGKLSGVPRPYISQMESGIYKNPSLIVICKLCKTLGITPNDLIPKECYSRDAEKIFI
ncbi:hypothetical protein CPJCM30710_25300 [Clostridium polyendosporum]|uniref:HTH cro/C1-type domain-containing protein n=1 Tax=Clostridium polyendosporum TaxID=69208 RepID=A0A919VF43_9CLOT|nr:helix-turn-helix transcriptional regulator [Clostridium polyendosporum]GIM29864.1 hypothetical protein CPJCM30710_25300 [Clostridium polyendosporum]